jgi:L-asparaginase / beta-aspartyl-peptidase
MKPALIVHGGAWDIPDALVDACKEGCRRALAVGWSILTQGGSALDTVTAAIVILEDDPVFDAGYGSHLNLDGQVECDAIVMDGATLRSGSIAAVKRIRNPIRAARALLEHGPHMMLVAEGAERYAQSHGIALCDPQDLISPAEQTAWQICKRTGHQATHHIPASHNSAGTVGAVALDSYGSLIAATSTGGTCCKLPGRVGDSPLIGCGCYADSEAGAASATGRGESIMKVLLTKHAIDLLRVGTRHAAPHLGTMPTNIGALPYVSEPRSNSSPAMLAAQSALAHLTHKTTGTAGLILLDRHGTPAASYTTPRMAHAYVQPDGSFLTSV